jgi:arsenate reductase
MSSSGEAKGVLFLSTGNSARSILAECLLRDRGAGRFSAHSAGSQPKAAPHPMALQLLAERGHATQGLRSKSWDEFAAPGAAPLEFIITVCDNAAGEICPIWPGHPTSAHWAIPDPAAIEAPETAVREAFELAYQQLDSRIAAFLDLPFASLEGASLEAALRAIGTPGKI